MTSPFDPGNRDRCRLRKSGRKKSRSLSTADAVVPDVSAGAEVARSYWEYSHPSLYDKRRALHDAVNLAAYFCIRNGVTVPAFVDRVVPGHYGRCSKWQGDVYLVEVDSKRCVLPQAGGASWSWPGFKSDRTVAGTTAHEVGHVGHWYGGNFHSFVCQWLNAVGDEPKVTGYAERAPEEDVAEAMKVFILNPSLLEACWPRRHAFLARRFEPVVTADWVEILGDSERHLKAVQNRIRSGHRSS